MKRVMILVGIGAIAGCNSDGKAGGASSALPPVTMVSSDSANHVSARFSPDGTRLFWWQPAGQGLQLWTAGADAKNPTMVPVRSVSPTPILFSADGANVAVTSSDSSLADVAVFPVAGGPAHRLTHVNGFAVPLGWNHDGDRVAYIASTGGSGGGTFRSYSTSLTHGGSAELIPGEVRPAFGFWSPDGSHIAYQVANGANNTIWVADSNGKNARQVTTDGFETFASIADTPWSPDSKWIAFESRRTGFSDVWVAAADSGPPRQLTRDVRDDYWPVWSQDSKWVAFMSTRGKQTDLWTVAVTGGQETRVTDDVAAEEPMQWLSNFRLAYLTGVGKSGIWSMSLADGSEKQLTPDSMRVGPPRMSPDGKQVALRIDRGGGSGDLAVMPVEGGPLRMLVQGGSNTNINWSPDGTQLAFISDRGGTNDIWTVAVAGGEAHQVENWPGLESQPIWSGNGKALYFISDHESKLSDLWMVAAAGGEPVRVTKQGTVANPSIRRGHAEVFASVINASGSFEPVEVKPDGSLRTVWNHGNSFPITQTVAGDSLVIVENGKQGYSYRLVPLSGKGEGKLLVQEGEGFGDFSEDGTQVLYTLPTGSTFDIAILNRADGKTRRLTTTAADENAPVLTPDGKTVLFQRSSSIRRIAIADLSKVLAGH